MQRSEALKKISDIYKQAGIESPLLETERLLMGVLECSASDLYFSQETVTEEKLKLTLEFLERRISGEPLAYILGYQYFYKEKFKVSDAVLVPRSDSETLIEKALSLGDFERLADLGVGSGCLGLSLLKELPKAKLWGCDLSEDAVKVAKENSHLLGIERRTQIEIGDVLTFEFADKFDLIVSNPPYISRHDERLDHNVKKYEPNMALFADNEGLEFYEKWTPWSDKALKKKGWLLFEVGKGQHSAVENILVKNNFQNVQSVKDLSGCERVVLGQKG